MHELSLCEGMLRIIKKKAAEDGFTRVMRVRVLIGDSAGVSEDALSFCFPMVCKDSVADGAELCFQRTSGNALRIVDLDVAI